MIVRSDDDAIERDREFGERDGRERWVVKVGGESGVSPENMVISGETK